MSRRPRREPRVCSMVKAPTPGEEDRRRICRERKTLVAERVEHVNRIKGLLFAQGICDYEPLRRNRRVRLEDLKTGDGRPMPEHLKAQVCRELDRLELLLAQIKAVEAERGRAACRRTRRSNAGGSVAQHQGRRTRVRRRPLVGRALPTLRQPTTSRRLCWLGADALAERIGRP